MTRGRLLLLSHQNEADRQWKAHKPTARYVRNQMSLYLCCQPSQFNDVYRKAYPYLASPLLEQRRDFEQMTSFKLLFLAVSKAKKWICLFAGFAIESPIRSRLRTLLPDLLSLSLFQVSICQAVTTQHHSLIIIRNPLETTSINQYRSKAKHLHPKIRHKNLQWIQAYKAT